MSLSAKKNKNKKNKQKKTAKPEESVEEEPSLFEVENARPYGNWSETLRREGINFRWIK
ncbi:hypothetical protein GCM10023339_73880 [Alloalcanivorax gelatiniphagus]